MVVVDGGDALAPPPPAAPLVRPGRPTPPAAAPPGPEVIEQRRVKAELIAAAYESGGIDAMALGASDWTLGADWVLATAKAHHLPILAANLKCGGEAPFPGATVVEAGGRRIGIVGLTDGAPAGCEVTEPVAAAKQALAALGPVDFTLALAPIEAAALARLGAAEAGIDAAVTSGGRSAQPVGFGSMATFEAGIRGKELGVLELSFVPGATAWAQAGRADDLAERIARSEARLADLQGRIATADDPAVKEKWEAQRRSYEQQVARDRDQLAAARSATATNLLGYRQVSLGTDVPDHAPTVALVAAAKEKVGAVLGQADPLQAPHRMPKGSAFAGSDVCATCHRAEHAQWAGTDHSHAFSTLAVEKRAQDPECWSCHVTAAGQEGGPVDAASVGPFRDVQCEACHGPGAAHAAAPSPANITAKPDVQVCTGCHDGDRDGGRFDPAVYLPKVEHWPSK